MPRSGITLGNGNSVFTEKPGFNLPGGGTFDWREGAYFADTWKIKPTFTLNAGLRWSVDTDRANQDLPTPPCSSVDAGHQSLHRRTNQPLRRRTSPGLGKKTHQPYANWGPQLGFAYNPEAAPNTVLRAGIGIFYESDVFNNTSNARSAVINASGPFFNSTGVCGGTNSVAAPRRYYDHAGRRSTALDALLGADLAGRTRPPRCAASIPGSNPGQQYSLQSVLHRPLPECGRRVRGSL